MCYSSHFKDTPTLNKFEQICYALFIKRYQLQTKPVENDSKSEKLVDELVETNQSTSSSYPKLLILRQIELVLWYMSLINLKIQKAMYITYFLSFTHFVMTVS